MTIQIQYPDYNVTTKDISKRLEGSPNSLVVTNIFYTLQGEGPIAGKPAVFVRTSGCNRGLKQDCPWCDTFFPLDKGRNMTFSQIENEAVIKASDIAVNSNGPAGLPWIVLTGGEPLIQPYVVQFLIYMTEAGWRIQIESNGDFLPDNWINVLGPTLVVSPKIGHNQKGYSKIKDDVFSQIDYLKFVVSADLTSPYHNLPMDIISQFKKGVSSVYISPMAVYRKAVPHGTVASAWDPELIDQDAARKNHAYAAQLCMKHGFSLSMQKHLFIGLE